MNVEKAFPDWLIGLVVTLLFLFITFTGNFDFTDPVEKKTFDIRARIAAPERRNPDIELVVINDDDLSELGRFPWPRDIMAQAIQHLSLAGAKVIALNIHLPAPEENAGLKTLRDLKEGFESLALSQEGPGLDFYKKLTEAAGDLDNDSKLRRAIKEAGNVVLPIYFDTVGSGRDMRIPNFMVKHSFKRIEGAKEEWAVHSLVWLFKIRPLLSAFAEAAAGIGHINLFPDDDGSIRSQIQTLGYIRDIYFPSFPVAIVKAFYGLKDEDITVFLGQGIHMRLNPSTILKIPVMDLQMRTLLNWNRGPDVAFRQTPFSKVYKNQFQTSLFRDKIVIIGPTAPGIGDRFVTPISGRLPGVEIIANSVENILSRRFFSRPPWIVTLEFGLLIFFGLFIAVVLPKLRAGTGAVSTLVLFLFCGVSGTVLFLSYNLWLKISPAMLLLVAGYLLVTSKKFLAAERTRKKVEADSVETNKMLGLSFQQQGMLDLALEKFRKLPLEKGGVKDLIYNLGLDFERKRQFSRALSTYQLLIREGKGFRDLDERIPKLKSAEASVISGASGATHPGDIGATLIGTDTRPTLGRYEVTGELGRGAMGVVYKGEDPKIHRTVAIKTIRLSDFDHEVLDEIKERFFREAESAGLLTHPNIVNIYDCGEEHDLAYIAMEFLDGKDLQENTKKGNLLPMRETLSIVSHVAEALDYAHARGVVHRDIKPANIVRLNETGEIRVTDFGIARVSTSAKTRTGIALGTPYYMSPEQIAGKKVDGRSDIFSLGIVLFEMLTGQKPFDGEDMTSLMYQTAKEPHRSARDLNPRIPQVVERIIDRALQKDMENRYQRAGQVAAHLKKVLAKIDEIQAKEGAAPFGRPSNPSGLRPGRPMRRHLH